MESVNTLSAVLLTFQVTQDSLVMSFNSLPTWHITQAFSDNMKHTEEVQQNTGKLTNVSETSCRGNACRVVELPMKRSDLSLHTSETPARISQILGEDIWEMQFP